MKLFKLFVIIAVMALAGCAGLPVAKYTEADLPQPEVSDITLRKAFLETIVTTPSCGESCRVRGEWEGDDKSTKKKSNSQRVQGNTPQKVVIQGVPPGAKGTVRIYVESPAGVVRFEKDVEIVASAAKTKAAVFSGFIPRRGASPIFQSKEECRQAAFAGAFDFYEPILQARVPVAPADGSTRIQAKLEMFYCLRMVTTAGVGWIVAAPKDQDFIWEGDKIVGHAKCLNEVFESDRLFPPSTVATDSKAALTLTQGSWMREIFVSNEQTSSIDWGRTAGLVAVVCILVECWGEGDPTGGTSGGGGLPGVGP
ncbi:MAG: hypothetical protein AAB471_01970 [Patescibacteria group bacterium]